MIKKKFLETITEYRMFQPGDLVLAAVSGGADSSALLNLLAECRSELKLDLHVAHLNHLLRKGEAELDVRYVENLAQKLTLPISVENIDVGAVAKSEKIGIEEAARLVRYDFFERTALKVGASKIAVGHTADDNVETFLMRLLRGSGLKGLCGIPPKRGKVVRPLIKVWRREIEDYVGALKLVPRRDHTNYESKYLRNSVRLKLIPQLKIYNMNIKEVVLQTILLLTEDRLYLEKETAQLFPGILQALTPGEVRIDPVKLQALALPVQGHLIRLAVEKVKGDLTQLSFVHVHAVLAKLGTTEKWEIHLPDGLVAYGERGRLVISRGQSVASEATPFRYSLPLPGELKLPEIGCRLRSSYTAQVDKQSDQQVAYIDASTLGNELVVRSKLPGDRFSPLGVKGTKKLQDFFVDEKIPEEERLRIPIIESGGRVVWVAGCRLDDRVKVTDKTKKIVKLELLCQPE